MIPLQQIRNPGLSKYDRLAIFTRPVPAPTAEQERAVTVLALARRSGCQMSRLPLELVCYTLDAIHVQARDYRIPHAAQLLALPARTTPQAVSFTRNGSCLVTPRGYESLFELSVDGSVARKIPCNGVPTSAVMDHDGNIVVTDVEGRVVRVMREDGSQVATIGLEVDWDGTGMTVFGYPEAVAVAPDGSIVAADQGRDCMRVFAREGTQVKIFGQFSNVSDVAVNQHGDIAAADTGNDRVQVFRSDGTLVRNIGSDGGAKLSQPSGVAFDHEGNLVVACQDYAGTPHCVVVFRPDGEVEWVCAVPGEDGGAADLRGVAVAPDGRIAVANVATRKIHLV